MGSFAVELLASVCECTEKRVALVPFASCFIVLMARDGVEKDVARDVHLRGRQRLAAAIGMQLADQCPMGLLDIVVGCGGAYAESQVVIRGRVVFDGHGC